jgi:cyclic beta-1,2-glucan synthetase
MEIAVSADDAVEIRRVTLRNTSSTPHDVELTSCAEVVIAPFNADRGHPAFSNLFVQTEWIPESRAILAMRRPRSAENDPVWCGHAVSVDATPGDVSCETDRAQFIGRGRTYRNPRALVGDGKLSNRTGAVLDPVFAIRTRLSIPAGDSACVSFATFMATDREHALRMAETCSDRPAVDELLARVRSQRADNRASLYQELAGQLLFPDSSGANYDGGKLELASLGISGEVPIVVARLGADNGMRAVSELLEIQHYWRSMGIRSDLVFVADHESSQLEKAVADANGDAAVLRDAERFTFPGYAISVTRNSIDEQQLQALRYNARMEIDCSTFELMGYVKGSR